MDECFLKSDAHPPCSEGEEGVNPYPEILNIQDQVKEQFSLSTKAVVGATHLEEGDVSCYNFQNADGSAPFLPSIGVNTLEPEGVPSSMQAFAIRTASLQN